MSTEENVNVKITGSQAGLVPAMAAAAETVKGGAEAMKGAMEGVSAAFEAALAPLLAFTAILKGGDFLKEGVDKALELTVSALQLGRQLGITTEEASVLNVALGDVYVTTETFSNAAAMLTRQLKTNEKGVKDLGVETRNSDGSFKNMQDLMIESIKVLNTYKEGTDRNIAATVLFGRGAKEIGPLLKLTADGMTEAKERAEQLNLVIDAGTEESVMAYKHSMHDVGDVMEGVFNTIGQAFIPILTEMANWFSNIGPGVVDGFKKTMDVLAFTLQAVIDVVVTLWNACSDVFKSIGDLISYVIGKQTAKDLLNWDAILKGIKLTILDIKFVLQVALESVSWFVTNCVGWFITLANVAEKALALDFDGAAAAWKDGYAKLSGETSVFTAKLAQNWKDYKDAGNAVMTGAAPGKKDGKPEGSGGGTDFVDPNSKAAQKAAKDALELAKTTYADAKKAATAAYNDHMKDVELNLALDKISQDQALAQQQTFEDQRYSVTREAAEKLLASVKANPAANPAQVKAAQDEILSLEQDHQAKLMDIRIKLATEATKEQQGLSKQAIDADEAAANDALAARQKAYEQEVALYGITKAKQLQQEQTFQDQKHQIEANAQAQRFAMAKADPQSDPVALQKMLDDMLQTERTYQAARQDIINQQVLESTAVQRGAIQSIQQSWQGTISQMLTLQTSFAQGLKGLYMGVVNALADALAKMIADWLAKQATAFVMNRLLGKANAASQITGEAGVAGASAFASTAAIPIIGPALAPAAAAAAFAGAMGFMGVLPAAAQGFDVPRGVNPITQLHEEEMVLPAPLSRAVRAMAAGDTQPGGRSGGVELHVHALDADSVTRLFQNNGEALKAVIMDMDRNGHFIAPGDGG